MKALVGDFNQEKSLLWGLLRGCENRWIVCSSNPDKISASLSCFMLIMSLAILRTVPHLITCPLQAAVQGAQSAAVEPHEAILQE